MADDFLAFTGTSDRAAATQFLEMAGGNLEAAVQLFFDNPGAASGGADVAMAEPSGGELGGGNAGAGGAADQYADAIQQFIDITATPRSDAEKYIIGSKGNVESAMARFFEGLGPEEPAQESSGYAQNGAGNAPAWYIFSLTTNLFDSSN